MCCQRENNKNDEYGYHEKYLFDTYFLKHFLTFRKMFKYGKGEMLGQTWEILYTDEQVKYFIENVFPEIAKNGKWSGKDVATAKDGSLVKEIVYLTALPDGGLVCTCIKDDD